jgi:GNAT superfamily N-acetyltransferase
LGLFTLPVLGDETPQSRPQLIAHVVATRTPALFVTDESMDYPRDWRSSGIAVSPQIPEKAPGHHEIGSTIAVHSLAVSPEHQQKRVGSTLMKAYIQRIEEALIADRIALLAHDHLVPFYESLGFKNAGQSYCTFGGGGWTNMVSI